MQSINFSTGHKEYAINGDEQNTIRVNISDINMLHRHEESVKVLESIIEKYKDIDKPTPEQMLEVDKIVREQINYIFDSDVSSSVFGNTHCMSPVVGGKPMMQEFLEAMMPLVTKDIQSAAQAQQIKLDESVSKYTSHLDDSKPQEIESAKLTYEQQAFLEYLANKEGTAK